MERTNLIRFGTLTLVLVLIGSTLTPIISVGEDSEDGIQPLSEDEQKLIGSDVEDPRDPGLFVRYKERYNTLKYEAWNTYSGDEKEVTIALESVVVRRGSTLAIGGYTEAEPNLRPTREDMDDLGLDEVDNGWEVDIPEDSTIGKYNFEITEDEWSQELKIYVIYDPRELSLAEEKRKAYAYDEEGDRDERAYFITAGHNMIPRDEFLPNLHPFGDDYEDRPSIYEFALAGAGSSSNPQESAARLNRIVAQRNDARPEFEPLIRDASDILFFGHDSPSFQHSHYIGPIEKRDDNITEGEVPAWVRGQIEMMDIQLGDDLELSKCEDWIWIKDGDEKVLKMEDDEIQGQEVLLVYEGAVRETVLDEELKPVEGLTLEDAEKLGRNGVSIHDLEGEVGRSKIINGWCDEVSITLVSLLRSIGIPSRIVSLHPTPEVNQDLMEHYFVEVWFEESMYDKSWNNDTSDGDWYVIDGDEWNVEFPSGMQGLPSFHMPVGETFSSRKNYERVAERLFEGEWIQGEYGRRWITKDLYVVCPEDEPLRVTDEYVDAGEHELEYGTVSKLIGRGGGDLYMIEIDNPTKLSIESPPQVEANLYVSTEEYPSIPTAIVGYPFEEPPEYEGEEAVLDPEEETYYIGVYGPQNGDREVEGNFGIYTLTIEETDEEELMDGQEQEVLDYDETIRTDHFYAMILLIIWVISYIGNKKL